MREERIEVEGVPARIYVPDDARALLLLGHGGTESKDAERFVNLSRLYAQRTGLGVVCIDAVDHGERAAPNQAPEIPKGWHSRSAGQMVKDWSVVVESLKSTGPAVAYVGFSMGAIFGFSIVESMRTMRAAAFVVGGIPHSGLGIDDVLLRPLLMETAARLERTPVLMLNKTDDEYFAVQDTTELFEAIAGNKKHLTFFRGGHDEWAPALIDDSVAFIREHVSFSN